MPAYKGINWGIAITQVKVYVSYSNKYAIEFMRWNFAEMVVRRFSNGDSNLHRISSVANQRVFVTGEAAEVERVVLRGGGLIDQELGEIVKPDEVV